MNRLALCALAMLLPGAAFAATVFIEPTRDNTLYESPSGRLSNALGEHMFTGLSQDLIARRAVIAFSDLRAIPEGATISSVKLHLHLSEENSDATRVDVHRLAADWGQGTSKPVAQEILGANATPDDPTWVHRFYDRIVPRVLLSRHAIDHIDVASIFHVGLELDQKLIIITHTRLR